MPFKLSDFPDHIQHQIKNKEQLSKQKKVNYKAIGQMPTGEMNKTEQCFEREVLHRMKAAHEVIDWKFEAFKIRLAKKTYYTTDFMVLMADRTIRMYEVKGRWEDDARVKFKAAAEKLPWFTWIAAKREAGTWIFEQLN
jgi:hypothetical protein